MGCTKLGVRGKPAGDTAAASLSLVGSEKLREIEAWASIIDVLRTLPLLGAKLTDEEFTLLLPDRWINEHPGALLPVSR